MVALSDNGGNTVTTMRQYAQQASAQTGWDAGLIYAQWSLETGNFTSHVFKVDNNLAGIKWVSARNNPSATGAGSPASDGGRYAHYPNLSAGVQGYVNFIKANPRYSNVKTGKTLKAQAEMLKADGWATDPTYVSKVISIAGGNHDVTVNDIASGNNTDTMIQTTSLKDKATEVFKSPILWVVILAGLIFKGL